MQNTLWSECDWIGQTISAGGLTNVLTAFPSSFANPIFYIINSTIFTSMFGSMQSSSSLTCCRRSVEWYYVSCCLRDRAYKWKRGPTLQKLLPCATNREKHHRVALNKNSVKQCANYLFRIFLFVNISSSCEKKNERTRACHIVFIHSYIFSYIHSLSSVALLHHL